MSAKEIVEEIIFRLKREGNGDNVGDTQEIKSGLYIKDVRNAFKWELPDDADNEEDYDWKVLTDTSCEKIEKIINEYRKKYSEYKIDWAQEEKNWISVQVEKR